MNDTRKFFRENRPQVSGSDEFMSEVKRQVDRLPDISRQEEYLRLGRKSYRMAVVSVICWLLVSVILCLALFLFAQSLDLLSDTFIAAILAMIFSCSVLIPLYKQDLI